MDLKQIRYFVAVAKERNFTRAAEQLHIAQPALSRQIQLLEQELNVLLLSRESRPLQLTEAGRIFYEQSLQLLNRVEVMKAATTEVGLHQRPQLSIGFVASTLYGGLPILIQIPVFFALYKVLFITIEMRHAPFYGWITDLSAIDPWYILPVLMGASMMPLSFSTRPATMLW